MQVGGTAETIYHDEPNNYRVKNRAQIDATNWAESITYFDGLGRAFKAEEINSQGNIFVEKEFDQDGRVSRVTNPFRTGETKQWTTTTYDESSRVKEVTLPDGAKVTTDYGVSTSGIIGVTKQITDQANKKRKGFSDALGRMVRVIEDPTGQNLSTDYVFDTLGNLRKTIQGEQSRYFMHDSLGRLLYAKQPEQSANGNFSGTNYTDAITSNNQWLVKYVYDDNGNITSTTDAKGVSVTGTYDNFNRLKVRNYSDLTMPDVEFYYDGKYLDINNNLQTATGSVKGKTTGIKSSVSKTNYTTFNNLGQLTAHQQITDGQTYQTSYSYDSFGRMISETYPSTRTVKVDYNADGDVSSIWGTVGTQNRLYANGFHYNSSGAMERMRLGNGKWETYAYNNRQQITEIGLGNSATDKSLLKLEYGYGANTENNGNLKTQKISFNGLAQAFEQTYTYDSLNRLKSATETVSGVQNPTWKQTFDYDRFGNRRFDTANTTTLGSCSQAVCNPLINTSDNQIKKDQNNDQINEYDFDANGNLTKDATGKQFLYDAENHQKEVKDASNVTIGLYSYDGEGKRVKKISATEITIFVYNGGGTLVAEYSTAIAQTPQVSYLTADHLGSPRVITNQNGAVTTRKDYMAFGDETYTAQRTSGLGYDNQSETRKGYTGYEKDDESGLEFAQARYYNTTHGRFTSVDPLTASANVKNPQTFNRYSYVLNSPYKYTDPLGLISVTTGACGGSCPNSGGSVDGSAFSGRDTSIIGNTIAAFNLNFNVRQAIQRIDSGDFDSQFTSNVTTPEREAIKKSLKRMLNSGNDNARNLTAMLVNGSITINVGDNLKNSAAAELTGVDSLNKAYENGVVFSELMAVQFFTITFDRTSWNAQSSAWKEPFIESNIIHEGTHVENMARILAAWSGGAKIPDMVDHADEYICKYNSTQYLWSMRGEWLKYGQALTYINKNGEIDTNVLDQASGRDKTMLSTFLINKMKVKPPKRR